LSSPFEARAKQPLLSSERPLEHPRDLAGGALHDGTGISCTSTDAELLEADDPRKVLGTRYPVIV